MANLKINGCTTVCKLKADLKTKGTANGIDDDIQLSYCIACV